jgi:phage host-nuclease inhibitor protein Gam
VTVAKKSTPLEEIVQTGDIKELNELARRRKDLLKVVRRAEKVEAAAIARARAKKAEKTKPLTSELKDLDTRILKLAQKRSVQAKNGKTIKLHDAVIRCFIAAPSLDTPRNTDPIVEHLKLMRRGNKFLTWTPSLNRDAITQSSPWTKRLLRPLGVRVRRHAFVTIKMNGDKDPTTLDRRPHPNRH